MTISATTRQPLHRQMQADRNLQQLCAGLTASTSLIFATLPANGDTLRTAATPPTAVPTAPPPQRTLGEVFDHALKAITSQDWQGFATQCASTVWNAPLDFGQAILVGIYEYVKKEVEGIAETASSICRWASDAWDCVWDIGASGLLDPDTILRSATCKPFHGIAKGMKAVADVAEQIKALGLSGVLEMVGEFMSGALELLGDLLRNLLQWLGDRAAAIRQWLTETARDVNALGGLAGSLIASILIEIATSGLGRALKTSKLVSRLPSALPGVRALPDMEMVVISARGRRDDMLDELADVIQKILSQKGPRFTRNMSLKKLRILAKHMPEHQLRKFLTDRDKLARALARQLKKMRGEVRPYHLSVEEAREFNRRMLAFHYSEAVAEGDFHDEFNLLVRRDAILPQIFESNHIVEARMFRSGRWRTQFEALGWDSETKMDAILLTSAEHTGSVRQMLLRQGIPEIDLDPKSEIDIRRIAPPNNVTRALLDKIKFRADVTGNPTGVLVIESNTPFSSVFSKYMEIYRQEMPDLWNAKLRSQFTTWKNTLDLDVPIPGPVDL